MNKTHVTTVITIYAILEGILLLFLFNTLNHASILTILHIFLTILGIVGIILNYTLPNINKQYLLIPIIIINLVLLQSSTMIIMTYGKPFIMELLVIVPLCFYAFYFIAPKDNLKKSKSQKLNLEEELTSLKQLKDDNILNEEQYEKVVNKLLNNK